MADTANPAVHHLAFRRDLAVPICGAPAVHADDLSLSPDRVGCGPCRRIVGLPAVEVSP